MNEMKREYFLRLFRYDQWANQATLAAFQATNDPPAKALKGMAHLVGAGYTWLARLKREECQLLIWPELTLEECGRYSAKLGKEWLAYLDALDSGRLQESVAYRNSKGSEFSIPIVDILTQVLTHGSYHRGQIAAEMRLDGKTPASTDFIVSVLHGALDE
jgi:uncharacterized damage-inducible protein DinB